MTLTAQAPATGAKVLLSSASGAVTVPASVMVGAAATSATFAIATSAVTMQTSTTISASYGGVTKTTAFTVMPAAIAPKLAQLSLASTSIVGGTSTSGTVTLTSPAGSAGAKVTLGTSSTTLVSVPASVAVAPGATSASFPINTSKTLRSRAPTVSASYGGVTKTVTLIVRNR